ncbi:MAG TPA: 3-hydroxyacyl-CoA dehydrogenase [Oceanospirillaceae bacterium]|nr:3-hydroxyacyl-CoA dehydrogenase [Oceanospirillaceae bacterium]
MTTALASGTSIAVIGAGTMGAGIAQVAAQAGHTVWLVDQDMSVSEAAIGKLASGLERLVGRGKISAEQAANTIANIKPTADQHDLAGTSLVIEAIVENRKVKHQVFADLMGICGADCIYASNTSSIPIEDIAEGLQYPAQMVGMHFFNPAQIMKLVEVISSKQTCPKVADVIYHTAAAWNKVSVHATDTPGFIVNRVARPFYAEALRMVAEGMGDYTTIDTVMREAGGFRMGPFELMDLIGHDVNYAVTDLVSEALYHPLFEVSPIQKALVDKGDLGRKTGRGYYDYSADLPKLTNTATPSTSGQLLVAAGDDILAPLWQRLTNAGINTAAGKSTQFDGLQLQLHIGAPIAADAPATVAFDIALDLTSCTALACQRNQACSNEQFQALANAFAAAGIFLIEMPNQAGLPVARTVAMLTNVAADAVDKQVCSLEDADKAMRYGVNYPQGPFIWADQLSPNWVHTTLANLAHHICASRYAENDWIAKHVIEQRNFYA